MVLDFEINFAVYYNDEFVAAFYLLGDAEGYCEDYYGIRQSPATIRSVNTGGIVACWQNGRWERYY